MAVDTRLGFSFQVLSQPQQESLWRRELCQAEEACFHAWVTLRLGQNADNEAVLAIAERHLASLQGLYREWQEAQQAPARAEEPAQGGKLQLVGSWPGRR